MTLPALSHAKLAQRLTRGSPLQQAQRLMAGQGTPTMVTWNGSPFPLAEVLVTQAVCQDQVPFEPVMALLQAVLFAGGHRDETGGAPSPVIWESLVEKRDVDMIRDPDDYVQRKAGWSRILTWWAASGQALDQRDVADGTLLHRAMERSNCELALALVEAGVPLAQASPGSVSIVPALQKKALGRTEWRAVADAAEARERSQARQSVLETRPSPTVRRPRPRS